MPTYSELLQDPRWDIRRKEILALDEYKCRECGFGDIELHVHHHFYNTNTPPWDYDDEMLITLCDRCHLKEETLKAQDTLYINHLLTLGFTRRKIELMIGILNMQFNSLDRKLFDHRYKLLMSFLGFGLANYSDGEATD